MSDHDIVKFLGLMLVIALNWIAGYMAGRDSGGKE